MTGQAARTDKKIVKANGINFSLIDTGRGHPVFFLHGFPENKEAWEYQIKNLKRNFRTVSPDLRGYGETEKPGNGYDIETLSMDIASLMESMKIKRGSIVGHDWGGVIAWDVACRYPEKVEKLVIINAPHPLAYLKCVLKNPVQLIRSWYAILFQLPYLPEKILEITGPRILGSLATELKGKERERLKKFLSDMLFRTFSSGSIHYGIEYYRKALPSFFKNIKFYKRKKVKCPVCIIWGKKDIYLSYGMVEDMKDYCSAEVEFNVIEEGSHWVNMEFPDRVNSIIREFLKR